MEIYTFDNKKYYSSEEIKKENPEFFLGCNRTLRMVVEKRGLKPGNYIYGTYIYVSYR